MMQTCVRSFWFPLGAALLWLAAPASAVTIDWVSVGGAGNAADDTGRGSVASVYQISKYEITNTQYAEFLTAVASTTDTYGLYNANMGNLDTGGITQLGAPGFGFTYTVSVERANMPVNYVSFYDALRFTNWLNNGQPTGAQGTGTTETGAYTFSDATTVGARNAGATIFLPSEDEWYKAAYYHALSTPVYYDYPAGSDTQTACATPTATPNSANCLNAVGDLTNVGSYTGSASPNGTFDQGGNVWEWNEAVIAGGFRGQRGGSYGFTPGNLAASVQRSGTPTDEVDFVGFRPAMVPEPNTALLVMTGMLTLAGWRRRHCRPSPVECRITHGGAR